MERERQGMESERQLYARTISNVVEYFEGYGTLAVILNVNVADLRRWAEGKSRPPEDVFLRIVDFSKVTSRTPHNSVRKS
jgi:hypothetical protein